MEKLQITACFSLKWVPGSQAHDTSTIMMVTKSSDESMRMRVLGFAKSSYQPRNGKRWKYEDGVRCDTRSGNKPAKRVLLKSDTLRQSRPIQYLHRRRTLPEFP